MLASFLLTFREGLEAALLIGIILGYLDKTGHRAHRAQVWAAVGMASGLSLALALVLQAVGARYEGKAEAVFEGFAMLLAVGVLTWMILWMRTQAHTLKRALEADLQIAMRQGQRGALFSIAFLAVFREGVELALFLTATRLAGDGPSTLAGGLLGLAAAIVTGWAIYSSAVRLNVRRFFDVTSLLLLIVAAGLFAHGLHEFQEAGWLPLLSAEAWNSKALLDDTSTPGALLRTLVGYNDNPTWLEVVGYLGYWLVVLAIVYGWAARRADRHAAVNGLPAA